MWRARRTSFLKTCVNVLAPTVALPDDPDNYPETYHFADFLDRTVQAARISESIRADPRIEAERQYFVPQRVATNGGTLGDDSVTYFRRWLKEPSSRLLAILAPAGYGKTALTCEMSHQLAVDYLARLPGSGAPFPYRVPFGEFRRLASFEAMILSSLQRQGVTDYTANAFAYLVERNRVLLILDGFDELLEERPEEARKNLRELIETLQGRGKVVVTARSTFFRTSDEVSDFLEYYLDASQVDVIELQPFDKNQRLKLISNRASSQGQIESMRRFVEAANVREAMGSPLLLGETIDALTDPDGDSRLDRTAGRKDLFGALEHSVYARERARHGHLFSNETQREFLEQLAESLLTDNARGFDFELVQVLAHEAAEGEEAAETTLSQLADHHFLTVDHDSEEARFNHQVFREYFQARSMLRGCESGSIDWIYALLGQRPIPEEVRGFLAELDPGGNLPRRLLDQLAATTRPAERLISNLGALIASYESRELLQALLTRVPHDVGLAFSVRDLDLSDSNWAGRLLITFSFEDCDLSRADFTDCVIADLSLDRTIIDDADFTDAGIDSLVVAGGPRTFGTPDAYRLLTERGAECGLKTESRRRSVKDQRREQLIKIIRDRLYRFYRPGQVGTSGSRWDSSIQEKNLLGGVAPGDSKFVKKGASCRRCVVLGFWNAGVRTVR